MRFQLFDALPSLPTDRCRRVFAVRFIAVFWTSFVVILLALPTDMPVNQSTMNCAFARLSSAALPTKRLISSPPPSADASVVTGGVLLLSWFWFFAGGRKLYRGPRNVLAEEKQVHGPEKGDDSIEGKQDKDEKEDGDILAPQ